MTGTQLQLSKVNKTKNGNVKVYVNQEGGGNVYVKTPKLSNSFGANDYQGNQKFGVNVKIEGKTLEQFRDFDEQILFLVMGDKQYWSLLNIKKQPTLDQLRMVYTPMVKDSDKYGCSMKFKLPTKYGTNELTTRFFNCEKEEVVLMNTDLKEAITYTTDAKYVVHLSSMWFINGRFGVGIDTKQVLFYPDRTVNDMLKELCVIDTSDDDKSLDTIEEVVIV